MSRHAGICKVSKCGFIWEDDNSDLVKCRMTWHVYEEHRGVWVTIFGDRPPRDPDPRTPIGRFKITGIHNAR